MTQHYKDKDNNLYGYKPANIEVTPITMEEVHTINEDKITPEQLADTARAERDQLIESVRWRIERHNDEIALGSEPTEPLEPLLQYVQTLRDVPQQAGFPESYSLPKTPECLP